MSYFLLISSLVFSLNSLSENSCKEQKKLLKETCSFKKDKIKSKNTVSLNSCKKIKDLFLDLKTKTKENYESCEKAYDTCTELCNRCNKSQVTKFKEKSKKNLKKIKRGFKKASKCLNQLSSDFEEKDQSFTDQYDHKKLLEFLKKEDLRKIKEEKRRHEEFLKKQKENRIIRQKLRKTSKKVFERQALSDWARKHKIRTYGKSTEEIKQLKIDYEVKQIKEEGRKERLKLKTQRRERLKKKFEADFLKTNPPKTKTTMVFEALTDTFSSYWNKTKSFFGRVFFGEFALAQRKHQCPFIDKIFQDKDLFEKLEGFITNRDYKIHQGSFYIKESNINQYKEYPYSAFIEQFFDEFKRHFILMSKDIKVCTDIDVFLNDTSDIEMSGNNEEKNLKAQWIFNGLKGFGLLSYWQGRIEDLEKIKSLNKNLIFHLCNELQVPLERLRNEISRLKNNFHIEKFKADDLVKLLDYTIGNNMYHVMAHMFTFRQKSKDSKTPHKVKQFLDAYFNSIEKVNSKKSLFAVPFIVFYLLKYTPLVDEGFFGEYDHFNYLIQDWNQSNECERRTDFITGKNIFICKYKPPLSIALDKLYEASQKEYGINYVDFYERYIASLLFIAKADIKHREYQYNYVVYDESESEYIRSLKKIGLNMIDDIEKYSVIKIEKSLSNIRKCFKAKD